MTAAVVLAVVLAQSPAGGAMGDAAPGSVEGRPAAGAASPLQALVDRAAPGERLVVPPGIYRGDLILDRPVQLVGEGRPRLVGSGTGSVVRIRANHVVFEGFDVDGAGGGELARDSSGIHVMGAEVVVRDCRVENALFGIYVRESTGARVERCTVRGIPGRDPGEKGSGIHVWNSHGFRLIGNTVVDARDGFYVQASTGGFIQGNLARDIRYGLHFMSSDDITFEDNTFERGAAGTALMYSKRLVFRRNRFLSNRGFASVGLLFKSCDDALAEDNLVADNARGIFIEGSYRDVVRRNVVVGSDTALVLYDSEGGHRFEGNAFIGNLSPLVLVGRRTDTRFEGNYWSDHDEPDLDGDGYSDRPFRLVSVFDRLRGNLTAADLMAQSFAASALGVAERTFPVVEPVSVMDARPLARPPILPAVPRPDNDSRAAPAGLLSSAAVLALGALTLRSGRRPARWRA